MLNLELQVAGNNLFTKCDTINNELFFIYLENSFKQSFIDGIKSIIYLNLWPIHTLLPEFNVNILKSKMQVSDVSISYDNYLNKNNTNLIFLNIFVLLLL